MKTCKRCGETRALADFYASKQNRDGKSSYCKECSNKGALAHRRGMNAEKRDASNHKWNLKAKYGLEVSDYDAMLAQQGGCCAICHRPNPDGVRLHVDHCHVTGKVRALLCRRCNSALGMMDDSPDRMRAAAAYIELHQSSQRRNTD